MSLINKALKKCEKMTDEQRVSLFVDSFATVLEATNNIVKDTSKASKITLGIILYAVAADGKFVEDEYKLVQFLIEKATGSKLSFPEAKALVESMGDPNEQIDYLKKYFLAVSEQGEDKGVAFICLIMTVLSIDGDVSYKEKKWMNKIF